MIASLFVLAATCFAPGTLSVPSSRLILTTEHAREVELSSFESSAQASELSVSETDKEAEYTKKREEAGKDIQKLWDLYVWCDANGLDKQGRSCLRAVLKEDDSHRRAHEELGHLEYDGKWFTTQKKLDKYKKEEEERIAEEEGLVRYEGEWVPEEHVPFLEQGLTLDPDGNWVNAEELEKIEAGWVRQDMLWVSPEEKQHIDEGLWKCGDEWKTLEEANEYHRKVDRMWVIPTESYILHTSCSREVATKALDHMERVLRDLKGVFGTLPTSPVHVVLLRNQIQYNGFAAGEGHNSPAEVKGLSSIHYSFFADGWFDEESAEFFGAGVGVWDSSAEHGDTWGLHSVRHAAALSLTEAMDPSPKHLAKVKKGGLDKYEAKVFWDEKTFPDWFRYGAASYAERYFVDQFVKSGGNYNWARDWSIENLKAKGGLHSLEDLFASQLSAERPEDSIRLLNEYGLILSFAIDGKCEPIQSAYVKLKDAIAKNDPKALAKAFKGLEETITDNEKALRAYAGL